MSVRANIGVRPCGCTGARVDGQHPRHGSKKRLYKGSSNIPFSFPSSPWPGEATVCLVYFVVWASCDRGGPFLVILVIVVQIKFFSTQPFEDYFKIIAAQITMTRTAASNWTPWYVDVLNTTKVQCLICREDFARKNFENVKPPWIHS